MTAGSQVTLATATGPIWLALVFHVLGGAIAIVAGFVAVAVAKGGRSHRRAGIVFVASMLVMSLFATIVGTYEMRPTAVGAVLTAYFVFTGLITVRPFGGMRPAHHVMLMIAAFLIALFEFTVGFIAMGRPHRMIGGVPGGMILFIGTIALFAAIGDWRMIRAGSLQGTRRLARHLWRMCFALFIASGSFFIGQTKFIPQPLRNLPLLMVLGVSPLLLLLYWMWRVRFRHSLRGLILSNSARRATAEA